jgi:sarcosine oxidase, subunit alpha
VTADLRDLAPGQQRGAPVVIDFEGAPVAAYAGESIAVALYAAGVLTLARSPKYHRPRGLFCLDGHCASCYLRIGGRPNQRACMTPARPGLRCERQNAFPSADVDFLTAADWLFRGGMDHHTLMTGSRVGNQLFLKLVRQMGGSGTLPDEPAGELPATTEEALDACVIGAGPAGLAAARAIAEGAPGARVTVYDEQAVPGGSLLAEVGGTRGGGELAAAAAHAGARIVSGATALAFYPEDAASTGQQGVLAVATADGLRRVSARRYVYATGAYDQNLPFADNDRPGVISARACGRLAFHYGVRPVEGRGRVIVIDGAPPGATLARGLLQAGVAVEVVDLSRERVLSARGGKRLRGLEVAPASGGAAGEGIRQVDGDVVAVAALPAPASELPRQHGVAVTFDLGRGGFAVDVGADHATRAPGVYACGDVTGYLGPEAARRAGAAAGRAVAASLSSP